MEPVESWGYGAQAIRERYSDSPYTIDLRTRERRRKIIGYSVDKKLARLQSMMLCLNTGRRYIGTTIWIPETAVGTPRQVFLTGKYYEELGVAVFTPIAKFNSALRAFEDIRIPDPVKYPFSSRAVRLWLQSMGLNITRFGASLRIKNAGGVKYPLRSPFIIPKFELLGEEVYYSVAMPGSRELLISRDTDNGLFESRLSPGWFTDCFPSEEIFDRYFDRNSTLTRIRFMQENEDLATDWITPFPDLADIPTTILD